MIQKLKYALFFLSLLCLFLIAAQGDPPVEDLPAFINWILAPDGGSFILIAAFIATLLEKIPAWANVKANVKWVVISVVTLLVGLLAVFLQANPAVVATVQPIYNFLLPVILGFLSLAFTHKVIKKPSE